jgi:hypothetical protein
MRKYCPSCGAKPKSWYRPRFPHRTSADIPGFFDHVGEIRLDPAAKYLSQGNGYRRDVEIAVRSAGYHCDGSPVLMIHHETDGKPSEDTGWTFDVMLLRPAVRQLRDALNVWLEEKGG